MDVIAFDLCLSVYGRCFDIQCVNNTVYMYRRLCALSPRSPTI
jgi:hypothetical protein